MFVNFMNSSKLTANKNAHSKLVNDIRDNQIFKKLPAIISSIGDSSNVTVVLDINTSLLEID